MLHSRAGYKQRDDTTGRVFGSGGSSVLLGKTDAAHAKGATGTISIYTGTTKGSETDSGRDITGVYNRFADLETGKWVHVQWVAGGWELSAAECA